MDDPISRLEVVTREIDRVFAAGYAAAHPDIVVVVVERVARALLGDDESSHAATMTDRFSINVTYDPERGYVGTVEGLQQPVIALSLGGLRRKVEALMSPDEVIVMLNLDKAARLERDRRRLTGRPRPGFAGTSA
jgi:hypothetical protein